MARLPRYLFLAQALVRDPTVSPRRKSALAAGIAYAALPVDLIPGVIPVLGQLDDLGAVLLGIRWAIRGCPRERARAHLARAGLAPTAIDADLRTIAVTSAWLVVGAASVGVRLVGASLRLLNGVRHLRGHRASLN